MARKLLVIPVALTLEYQMKSFSRPATYAAIVSVVLVCTSSPAVASLTTYSASQSGKETYVPSCLVSGFQDCAYITPAVQNNVKAAMTGVGGFDQFVSISKTFSFETISDTPTVFSGAGEVIDGNNPPTTPLYDFSAGRYNMTGWQFGANGGLPDLPSGARNNGHWYESFQTFTLDFGQNISAISFFLTDFTDFDGHLSLTLLADPSDASGIDSGDQVFDSTNQNAGLTFFGLTSTTSFRAVRFNISQPTGPDGCNPNRTDDTDPLANCDFLGFDEISVGAFDPNGNPAPEPGTLLLAAAGLYVARRMKQVSSER